jgi:hypothetical protein
MDVLLLHLKESMDDERISRRQQTLCITEIYRPSIRKLQ